MAEALDWHRPSGRWNAGGLTSCDRRNFFQKEAYSQNILGCEVTCLAGRPSSAGGSQRRVCLVTRERPNGSGIDTMRFHRADVLSFKIRTRHTRNSLVSAYLPPAILKHLPDFEENLQQFKGLYPIIIGDLNVDLDNSWSSRIHRMAYLLTKFNFIDLVRNFQKFFRFQDLKTWTQVRQGTILHSRCDYILRTERRHFKLVGTWDMHNYTSDYFVIQERLLICPNQCHAHYLQGRRALPLKLPPATKLSGIDPKFQTLNIIEPPPHNPEEHPFPPLDVSQIHLAD